MSSEDPGGGVRRYPLHVQLLAVVGILAVFGALYGAVAGLELGIRAVAVEPGCRRACDARGEALVEVHYTSAKYGKCFCRCTRTDLRHTEGDWAHGVSVPVFLVLLLVAVGGGAYVVQRRRRRREP